MSRPQQLEVRFVHRVAILESNHLLARRQGCSHLLRGAEAFAPDCLETCDQAMQLACTHAHSFCTKADECNKPKLATPDFQTNRTTMRSKHRATLSNEIALALLQDLDVELLILSFG